MTLLSLTSPYVIEFTVKNNAYLCLFAYAVSRFLCVGLRITHVVATNASPRNGNRNILG